MNHRHASTALPGLLRWLLFLGLIALLTALFTREWTALSSAVFGALVVGSLALGIRGAAWAALRKSIAQSRAAQWALAYRAQLSQSLAVGAVLLVAISAFLFRPANGDETLGWALLAAALGGLALGAAVSFQPERARLSAPTAAPSEPLLIRRRAFALGVFGIGLFSEMSGRVLGLDFLAHVPEHAQFLLLCVSAGLIVWSAADGRWPRGWPGWLSAEALLLLAIMGLALFLRLWELNTSIRTLVDEVHFSSGVVELWRRDDIGLMTPMSGLSPFPWIYPYWQTMIVELMGRTLAGMRGASAVIGTLNVAALYLLARAFFDRKTAALAAFLLAVYPPHLHFSRVAILQIADPLFATLGFAFLGRGLRDNRRADYALGGAGIAFSQYFYEAGRLLFPPLAVLWLAGVAFLWRGRIRAHWRGLLTAALTFALLTIPVYYPLFALDYPLTGRLNASGLDQTYWNKLLSGGDTHLNITPDEHLRRLTAPWLFYIHQPEQGSAYYGGTEPLVMSAAAPFFLLGLAYAARRLRSPGPLLMLLWLLSSSFGNSLLVGSAVASRYLVVYPLLALFIALGLRYTLPLVWPDALNRQNLYVRHAVGFALAIGLAVVQVWYYFGPHLDAYQVQSRPRRDVQDAALRSVDFPPGTRIHVISDPVEDGGYGNEMLAFFADGLVMGSLSPDDVNRDFIYGLKTGVDHAFFLEPGDFETLNRLRAHLQLEGPFLSDYPMPPRTQFILYYAPYILNPETIGRPEP